MTEFHVPLIPVDEVKAHPGADRLDLVVIGGWQVAVPKGSYREQETVLFVPVGSVVPAELADRWGVRQYLDGPNKDRVRAVRLRGEMSFGFTVKLDDLVAVLRRRTDLVAYNIQPGEDLAELFGITKYVPSTKSQGGSPGRPLRGDSIHEDALMTRYTDIDSLRHYLGGFTPGEEVIVTTKIHGANSRSAFINGTYMAASRKVQRRDPSFGGGETKASLVTRLVQWFTVTILGQQPKQVGPKATAPSLYWHPIENIPGVEALLYDLGASHGQAILFGELYGPKIQPFSYGLGGDAVGYAAFDIMLNGQYVSFDEFEAYCTLYKIPMAPVLYRGPFDIETIKALANAPESLGGDHPREGVVVRPPLEGYDPKFGRRILKWISDDYYAGKHEDVQEALELVEAEETAA